MPDNVTIELENVVGGPHQTWPRFLLGLGALAVIALSGYFVFFLFAAGGLAFAGWSYLAIAVVAGAGAFFSPCSFPLLPSYFAYAELMRNNSGPRSGALQALLRGSAAAAGVVSFNTLLGLAFGVAGLAVAQSFVLLSPNPSAFTVGARLAVGGALFLLGLVQIANLSAHGGLLDRIVGFLQPRVPAGRPLAPLFLYGFAYTLVGIGCTAPFLATVIVLALASSGFVSALAAFLVFALTMAALMIIVSLVASSSRRRFLKTLSARTPTIKRTGGVILSAFGAVLLVLTAWPTALRPLFP